MGRAHWVGVGEVCPCTFLLSPATQSLGLCLRGCRAPDPSDLFVVLPCGRWCSGRCCCAFLPSCSRLPAGKKRSAQEEALGPVMNRPIVGGRAAAQQLWGAGPLRPRLIPAAAAAHLCSAELPQGGWSRARPRAASPGLRAPQSPHLSHSGFQWVTAGGHRTPTPGSLQAHGVTLVPSANGATAGQGPPCPLPWDLLLGSNLK